MDRLRRSMRTRVSTLMVLLLILPALMGCFGEDAKPPAKVEHPFGFDEAIASGVWYHIGGSPSDLNVTNILNESQMSERGFSMDMFNGSNVPYWTNGTYYGTGFDTFEPTIGILSDGTIVFTNWGGTGTGTMIIRSQDQGQTWENVGPFGQVYPAGQVPNSNDPYIYVDPWTDRIVKFDMHALAAMYVEYSDDAGDTWSPPFSAYGYYLSLIHI